MSLTLFNPDAVVLLLVPVAFLLSVIAGPRYIARLRAYKVGKQIRVDGPNTHMAKAGTPTMGGWIFIVVSCLLSLVALRAWAISIPVVVALLAFGTMGAVDDWTNLRSREGLGLRVRYKVAWHMAIALGISLILFLFGFQSLAVPFSGSLRLDWLFIPFATFVIFACTSGVNEADGLDGLAAGTSTLALAAYLIIAWWIGQIALAAVCAILIGSLLGFLWYNVNPAAVFMGDSGSLALGAALAVVALQSGAALALPIVGVVFVAELLSVILQVVYFKLTGGKRIFRMSPLHHHFELAGWSETKVVQRFWLVGALAAAAGVALAIA